jgi:hypothetical protein
MKGSIKRRVRQLLSLPATSWWVLFQAWICILVMDLGLRCGARSKLQRMASPSDVRGSEEPSPAGSTSSCRARAEHLAHLVDLAACFHLHSVRCLTRALTLQYLLTRRGLSTVLRFGVRTEGGQLRAHAWLELGGEPLGEAADVEQRFKPLVPLSLEKLGKR